MREFNITNNRTESRVLPLYTILATTVFVVAIIGVIVYTAVLYSKIVNLKHDVARAENDIASLTLENDNLESEIFKIAETKELERIASEKGLIRDDNPRWVFASL